MDGKLRNMTAIYLLKGDKVLLLYRQGGKVVNNVWTGSAGGHFEKDELNDARACVIRELKEELGLSTDDVENLKFRYVCLRSTKGEIRQNFYFFAELKDNVDEGLHSNEGICNWFSLEEISGLEMPLTAKYMMEHFCKVGRFTDKVYVGVTYPDRIEFNELVES
ncbi:MAG: NUDIX domain-containing protein [Agathobacter sp.]|nr:NUDIX domain-containing protein [Agathobacter sp.]